MLYSFGAPTKASAPAVLSFRRVIKDDFHTHPVYTHTTIAARKITTTLLYITQCIILSTINVTKATRPLVHKQNAVHRVRPTNRSKLKHKLAMMSLIAVVYAHKPHTLTKTTAHWILTSKSMTIMC